MAQKVKVADSQKGLRITRSKMLQPWNDFLKSDPETLDDLVLSFPDFSESIIRTII